MKKIPLRTCIGCKEIKPKKELIRVVKQSDGKIMLDFTGKANGRGAYLCATQECLKKARKNKGIERSFKMSIPSEVYENLEREFAESEEK